MLWSKRTPDADNEHEVNMTPLIDVSLVLVVMLLLATPLAFESSIAVQREDATGKSAQKKEELERVELYVVSNDEVRVNRTAVTRDDLEPTLRAMLLERKDRNVTVTCAAQVSHGIFVEVLDTAKISGATGIAVTERGAR